MISRQKLIKQLERHYILTESWQSGYAAERVRKYHDYVMETIESQPPADVPDTNVGEITKAQAIEALKTLKTYCNQYLREDGVVADYTRSCGNCPLYDWCFYDRECLTPDDWQIPQERTEE